MRLREKLLLSFLIPLILLGVIALTSLSWTYNNFESVIANDSAKIQSVLMMTIKNHQALKNLLQYSINLNESNLKNYKNNLTELNHLLNLYSKLKLTHLERSFTNNQIKYVNQFDEIANDFIEIVSDKKKVAAQIINLLNNEKEENNIDLTNKNRLVKIQNIRYNLYQLYLLAQRYSIHPQKTLKEKLQNLQLNINTKINSYSNLPSFEYKNIIDNYQIISSKITKYVQLEESKIKLLNQLTVFSSSIERVFEKNILSEAEKESALNRNEIATLNSMIIALITIVLLLSIVVTWWFATRFILKPIRQIKSVADAVAKGEVDNPVDFHSKDEFGDLASSFRRLVKNTLELANIAKSLGSGDFKTEINPRSDNDLLAFSLIEMKKNLQELDKTNRMQVWEKTQVSNITNAIQGVRNLQDLLTIVITELSTTLGVGYSAFFLCIEKNNEKLLQLKSSYAYENRKKLSNTFKFGEGIVGQCALEKKKISITDIPDDYVKISSGLGSRLPSALLAIPVTYENNIVGVFEFAAFREFTKHESTILEEVAINLGIIISNVISSEKTEDLLKKYQELAEQLKMQKEELRSTNDQLEEKARILKESEEELKAQSEELQVSNEELEEKTNRLEQQNKDIEKKNLEIEKSREELEIRAKELSLASKYKSEFLANMSHELRTPLNSLLILSKNLSQNKSGNLTEKQVESAKVIYKGGNDLLALINDILDLSKVEAGKLEVYPEEVTLKSLLGYLEQQFLPVTQEKKLSFSMKVDPDVPDKIFTDEQRLTQIIRNLLSNAIKFTDTGNIELIVSRSLSFENHLSITVKDTGIGIPSEKQKEIFEAFQQADGSTSRKYGGTGLGLAISKAMTKLLSGQLSIKSAPNEGSEFTITIPFSIKDARSPEENILNDSDTEHKEIKSSNNNQLADDAWVKVEKIKSQSVLSDKKAFIRDDRDKIESNKRKILIVEDDRDFAKILLDLSRENGFDCLCAGSGHDALMLADKYLPSAIILDLGLPDIDGKEVLKKLHENNNTKNIPVHIISARDKSEVNDILNSTIGYLLKPANKKSIRKVLKNIESVINSELKKILVVEDDKESYKALYSLISENEIVVDSAFSAESAKNKIMNNDFDCIILDLTLPDYSGLELLKQLSNNKIYIPPLIVYTKGKLTEDQHIELQRYTTSIFIKDEESSDRLRDEVVLFLHSIKNKIIEHAPENAVSDNNSTNLKGKKILIVDDDMRNVFALSNTLEDFGIDVVIASNGKLAIEKLQNERGIDLVLMDIMMPIMDGYESMERIRKIDAFKSIPIIALTAKAMPGDKERCLKSGASDYITKPVNIEHLVSMIKLWLFK